MKDMKKVPILPKTDLSVSAAWSVHRYSLELFGDEEKAVLNSSSKRIENSLKNDVRHFLQTHHRKLSLPSTSVTSSDKVVRFIKYEVLNSFAGLTYNSVSADKCIQFKGGTSGSKAVWMK